MPFLQRLSTFGNTIGTPVFFLPQKAHLMELGVTPPPPNKPPLGISGGLGLWDNPPILSKLPKMGGFFIMYLINPPPQKWPQGIFFGLVAEKQKWVLLGGGSFGVLLNFFLAKCTFLCQGVNTKPKSTMKTELSQKVPIFF